MDSVVFAVPGKINWGLDITGLRPDGYHLLDMLMQRIDLSDVLRVRPAEGLSLTVDGEPAGEENLVMRAALALKRRTGYAGGAAMALEKRIPARAGLGGGSADCAAALTALNRVWGLGLSREALMAVGLTLGADVPFCLTGGLARVRGIGERIEPVAGAPRIPLVLAVAGDGLATGAVFGRWDAGGYGPAGLDAPALARAVVRRDLRTADGLCANALLAPALALEPAIGALMARLRALGASAAFMTGSGSCVVGAFDGEADAVRAARALPGAMLCHTLGEGEQG